MRSIDKICVWGDSIFRGVILDNKSGRYVKLNEACCVTKVEQELHVPIQNFSRFGMTSKRGLELMEKRITPSQSNSIAVIEFGGNDVDYKWQAISENPNMEHYPNVTLSQYKSNVIRMVQLARKNNYIPVLITLPPISSERYFTWLSKNIEQKGNILKWLGDVEQIYRSHESYSKVIKKIAGDYNCYLIDVRSAFLDKTDYSIYLCDDGIHPNEEGHSLMAQEIINYAKVFSVHFK